MKSPERMVEVDGVELCAQTFGSPDDPPVLLVMGAAASMLHWEDEFCERLAAGSRFVIRYDHRDTGRSVNYPPGAPGYTGDDLISDAAGLLDALGMSRAHVVGFSMGGAMAQLLALDHADQVLSLTLISTSPGAGNDLPGMSERMRAHFAEPPPEPDWVPEILRHTASVSRSRRGGRAR
jgi:pimeloyl-ACP methyl ester carboxylesterase